MPGSARWAVAVVAAMDMVVGLVEAEMGAEMVAATSATSVTDLDTLLVTARKIRTVATAAMELDTSLVTAIRAPTSPHATTAARQVILPVIALKSVTPMVVVVALACLATTVTRVDIWLETVQKGVRLAIPVARVVTLAVIVTRNPVSGCSISFHLY